MISQLFHAAVYDPLYNGVTFFVGVIPSHDIGLAIIALTIVVRIIIFPLSGRAIKAQMAMKKIAPEIELLKAKYKDKREEQGKAIFALYKERGVHPFSSIGLVLIQFPILIGLYWVFYAGGFPEVDPSLLYSFVHVPPSVNMEFLGVLDMSKRSVILAVLAAVTQFIYTRLSMGPRGQATAVEASLSSDMARSFDLQARYVLPAIIGVIAYTIPSAAPLYWVTSNIFMIIQEYASGRRFDQKI
ncbi:membrane protein insertase YidC [Candidatus Kaiserbacteria bacterium]|nr:membrane protein insertase YidC [Candidatus Kaiserbacteria bacterium]